MNIVPITHAVISVFDKLGLADFARALAERGVEVFASGGTRKHLEQSGLAVREISDYTGFPEMMDGRIKTLHPKVHGGILARHNRDDDLTSMREHGIVHNFRCPGDPRSRCAARQYSSGRGRRSFVSVTKRILVG
jgi:phosphoribosylaminoimidazolecarboxamide formyltransferase/IMP cyclohydrolase